MEFVVLFEAAPTRVQSLCFHCANRDSCFEEAIANVVALQFHHIFICIYHYTVSSPTTTTA